MQVTDQRDGIELLAELKQGQRGMCTCACEKVMAKPSRGVIYRLGEALTSPRSGKVNHLRGGNRGLVDSWELGSGNWEFI